jgi:glyoxylase I family protein
MAIQLAKAALDVGLVTDDGEKALAFYRNFLGFPEDGEVPFPGLGVVKRFRVGESIFRILVLETPAAHRASTQGFASQTGLRYMTLTVANLDEVAAAAEAAGYPVPVSPRTIRPGVRAAQIEDGLGTTVELMQVEG